MIIYMIIYMKTYIIIYMIIWFQALRQQNLNDNIKLKVKTCSNYRQDLNEKTVSMNDETPTGINYHVGLTMFTFFICSGENVFSIKQKDHVLYNLFIIYTINKLSTKNKKNKTKKNNVNKKSLLNPPTPPTKTQWVLIFLHCNVVYV